HDHTSAYEWVLRSGHRDVVNDNLIVSLAIAISLDVSEITSMTLLGSRKSMGMALGIVMPTGTHTIGRRAVAVLVNVEGMLLTGIQSLEMRDYFHFVSLLGEHHLAMGLVAGGWMQHSYG